MLTNVAGDFVVADNQVLRQLGFPELRMVTGAWSVSDTGALSPCQVSPN